MKPRQEIVFRNRRWKYEKEVHLLIYRNGNDKIYVDMENKITYRGVKLEDMKKECHQT